MVSLPYNSSNQKQDAFVKPEAPAGNKVKIGYFSIKVMVKVKR